MYKLRLVYMKSKTSVYIPSIDICDVIAKALIRVGAKLSYSNGKNVKPEIVNASTLPIGFESDGEICDVIIKEHMDIAYLVREINKTLPVGMIVLSAQYVDLEGEDINKRVYASTYEIKLVFEDSMFIGMNKKQIEDIKKWHRNMFEEYLAEPSILALKKTLYRQERIDIKEDIIDYKFLIDNRLKITVYTKKDRNLNPEHIMSGYIEYINRDVKYNIKRIKILYE